MIPVYQTLTIANDNTGNCTAACIASILERPLRELPNILPAKTRNMWNEWDEWLSSLGLSLNYHPLCHGIPKGYTLASGDGGRVFPEGHENAGEVIWHTVVAFDGKVVHDPYPGGNGIKEIKYYWTLDPIPQEDLPS